MRLSHILVAGATAVSFSAFAADEQKSQQQPQAQGSSQSQSASGGATQSSGAGQSGGAQQASQSQETIKQAQEKLSAAGHEVQADGIMGPKTQAALKEFQQQKGLQASGQLDQQTLSALGVSESASASTGASAEKSGAGASQESASGASSQGAAGGASAEPKSESKEKSKY